MKNLKIAIIGYGRMGKEIEKYALASGHSIHAIIDNDNDWETKLEQLQQSDVAIEFTMPSIVVSNLKKLMELNVPVVTGTTGWWEQLPDIEQFCARCNASLFYASNFSIGVNLFFALNRYLANLMSNFNQYSLSLEETHHTQKLDAPSGTAISMVKDIVKHHKGITGWKFATEAPSTDEIAVTAHRIENVTGTHKLIYKSEIDTISIEHIAHNREGFARGALLAAQWLPGRKGVFTMNDLLKL